MCVYVCVCVFFGHAKQARWILVHQPGIELVPVVVEALSLLFFSLTFILYFDSNIVLLLHQLYYKS